VKSDAERFKGDRCCTIHCLPILRIVKDQAVTPKLLSLYSEWRHGVYPPTWRPYDSNQGAVLYALT
jgi:hypothetical protein